MSDELKKIMEANPAVNPQVVEEFERAKKLLADARVIETGSTYSLDLPFEHNQVLQPALSQIAKHRPAR